MRRVIEFFVPVVFSFAILGCGDGSDATAPRVFIESPTDGIAMVGGETFNLRVLTSNFELGPPVDTTLSSTSFVGQLARQSAYVGIRSHEEDLGEIDVTVSEELEHEASPLDAVSSTGESHGHEAASQEMGSSGHGQEVDEHAHGTGETNLAARRGHFHIYLDDAVGSDPHITSWSHETPVTLPPDISLGMHSLRIELRDDNHVLVGSRFDEVVFFEVVE